MRASGAGDDERVASPGSPDSWARAILGVTLSDRVPIEVQRLFEAARGSMVYGCFYSPLFTLVTEQLFRTAEAAVFHKCRSLNVPRGLRDFSSILKWLGAAGAMADEDLAAWHSTRWYRNNASHPDDQSEFAPGSALTILKATASQIDKLFATPSPRSTAGARRFRRYVGIDYSGAATSTSGLAGLRVYMSDKEAQPVEVQAPGPKKHWTRRGIAEWLIEFLSSAGSTIVGIDHGFSFPKQYFVQHRLAHDWPAFLEDFHRHWPTDEPDTTVDFVREGIAGNGAARLGERSWRRLTEIRARAAKSVFHFDVQGSVAKSTHTGIPWLRHIRRELGERVHFWPFDGWGIPAGNSAIVEVYPRLWNGEFDREKRTPDQHDAWSVAEKPRELDLEGQLGELFSPELTDDERRLAEVEGWILGVR
jgi:hypothetical protein